MTSPVLGTCWNCGHELTRLEYGREDICPDCQKATHCCRNCRHHAPGRANECMEPMVERIVEKTRANFCELFEPHCHPATAQRGVDEQEALRKAAEDLFK